jgi:pantoate--beta-alanine ligase
MHVATRTAELSERLAPWRADGRRIAFVPTMGNLHAGHFSLLARAREHADVVVASVFVNPTQFGLGEDFARYPRTPEADAAALAAHGCDVLFLPDATELYPDGPANAVTVRVPGLSDILEGAVRPGHFEGVATVVARLFNRVQPDIAVFGQKDYQQLLVIRRMARDLGWPIGIVAAPIVREANGLAMSSRNQYLAPAERERASAIHATLEWMGAEAVRAEQSLEAIETAAGERLRAAGLVPDYAVLRHASDLSPPVGRSQPLVALVAARSGTTRLIDNLLIEP